MSKKKKGFIVVLFCCMTSAFALFASGCGAIDKVKDKIEQSKCNHVFDEGTETKVATCVEEGELTYTCTLCDKKKTENISKIDHVEIVIQGYPATCEEAGISEYKICEVCETVLYEATIIPAKGHDVITDVEIAVTCTTSGKTKGSHCGTCGIVLVKQENLPATGHNLVTINGYPATCTTPGLTDGSKCSLCNYVFTQQRKIDVLGHEYDNGKVTKTATCVATGTIVYTCQVCYATNSQPVPATGEHNVVTSQGYAATCTTPGLTNGQKCSICNKIYVAQEVISALGHSLDDGQITLEATCGKNGVKVYTCTVCGGTVSETIPATGAHTAVVVSGYTSTCTKPGLTDGRKCSVCDIVITAQEELSLAEHTYVDGVCSVCGIQKGILYSELQVGDDLSGYSMRLRTSSKDALNLATELYGYYYETLTWPPTDPIPFVAMKGDTIGLRFDFSFSDEDKSLGLRVDNGDGFPLIATAIVEEYQDSDGNTIDKIFNFHGFTFPTGFTVAILLTEENGLYYDFMSLFEFVAPTVDFVYALEGNTSTRTELTTLKTLPSGYYSFGSQVIDGTRVYDSIQVYGTVRIVGGESSRTCTDIVLTLDEYGLWFKPSATSAGKYLVSNVRTYFAEDGTAYVYVDTDTPWQIYHGGAMCQIHIASIGKIMRTQYYMGSYYLGTP